MFLYSPKLNYKDLAGFFGNLLGSFFKAIFSAIAGLCNTMIDLFKTFAGISNNTINVDKVGGFLREDVPDIIKDDLIIQLFSTNAVRNVLTSLIMLGILLLIIFTIISIIKNQYASESKPWNVIVSGAVKGLAGFIFVPIVCIFGVWFGNILLRAVNGATNGDSVSIISTLYRGVYDGSDYISILQNEGYDDDASRMVNWYMGTEVKGKNEGFADVMEFYGYKQEGVQAEGNQFVNLYDYYLQNRNDQIFDNNLSELIENELIFVDSTQPSISIHEIDDKVVSEKTNYSYYSDSGYTNSNLTEIYYIPSFCNFDNYISMFYKDIQNYYYPTFLTIDDTYWTASEPRTYFQNEFSKVGLSKYMDYISGNLGLGELLNTAFNFGSYMVNEYTEQFHAGFESFINYLGENVYIRINNVLGIDNFKNVLLTAVSDGFKQYFEANPGKSFKISVQLNDNQTDLKDFVNDYGQINNGEITFDSSLSVIDILSEDKYYTCFFSKSATNWFLGIIVGAFLLYALLLITFGVMKRMFILIFDYALSPVPLTMSAIDGGSAMSSWTKDFVSNVIMAYSSVIVLNVYMSIWGIFTDIEWVSNNFLNAIITLVVFITGLLAVKGLITNVSNWIGGANAYDEGKTNLNTIGSAVRKTIATGVGIAAGIATGGATLGASMIAGGKSGGVGGAFKQLGANVFKGTNSLINKATGVDVAGKFKQVGDATKTSSENVYNKYKTKSERKYNKLIDKAVKHGSNADFAAAETFKQNIPLFGKEKKEARREQAISRYNLYKQAMNTNQNDILNSQFAKTVVESNPSLQQENNNVINVTNNFKDMENLDKAMGLAVSASGRRGVAPTKNTIYLAIQRAKNGSMDDLNKILVSLGKSGHQNIADQLQSSINKVLSNKELDIKNDIREFNNEISKLKTDSENMKNSLESKVKDVANKLSGSGSTTVLTDQQAEEIIRKTVAEMNKKN